MTAAVAVAAALPGFAVYAMPIQTAYPQESIYLFDADTGEALVEQNPDMVRHVASLTKMMTALLVIENGADLNASLTIPDSLTPEFQSIKANRGHTIGLPSYRPCGQEKWVVVQPSWLARAFIRAAKAARSPPAASLASTLAASLALGRSMAYSMSMRRTLSPGPGEDRAGLLREPDLPAGGRHGALPSARHQCT